MISRGSLSSFVKLDWLSTGLASRRRPSLRGGLRQVYLHRGAAQGCVISSSEVVRPQTLPASGRLPTLGASGNGGQIGRGDTAEGAQTIDSPVGLIGRPLSKGPTSPGRLSGCYCNYLTKIHPDFDPAFSVVASLVT